MCSPDKNTDQLKIINNDDNLNAGICSSSLSSGSASSSEERPIDLLKPRVKRNKSTISDRTLSAVISRNQLKYWDAEEGEEGEEFDEVYTNRDESVRLQNKVVGVVRRRSGITYSDFQLRKSEIERLLLSPEEIEERKNARKLEAVKNNTNTRKSDENNCLSKEKSINKLADNSVNKGSVTFTHKRSINGCNNYQKHLAGGSEFTSAHELREHYNKNLAGDSNNKSVHELREQHHKSSGIKLKGGNINKSIDRLFLTSISRRKLHEQSSRPNFKCPLSKYSLTKQSDEKNTSEQTSQQTLKSNINLLKIHESQSNRILKESFSPSSQLDKSLLSKSRSESDIDQHSSSYSTSPKNILCYNENETEDLKKNRKHKKFHSNKFKPWTIQGVDKEQSKAAFIDYNIMYCGDSDHRSSLYSKYSNDLYKEGIFKHQIDSKEKDVKRVFPFEATPSGNLKVGPKQVVFESKKVSVLVADPHRTKVNVKADVDAKPTITTSGERAAFTSMQLPPVPRDLLSRMPPIPINRMAPPPGIGGLGMGRADGDFPSLSPPVSFVARSDENSSEETRGDGKKHKHIPEMNLSRMGYNGKDQIDWGKITLPLKSDLHKLLHHRISNYINPDFLVQIANHEYRCHLLVLQCYSSFFENIDKSVKTVDLSAKNVTGEAFESLYTWMLHLGQDSYQLLRRDNILEMFMAAEVLGVKELEEQCWAFIDNEELFSEDTAFLLYLDARRLGHTAVMELMVPRIQRFFLTLVSSKDWLDLQVDEVTVFLRSNYICIHCEMEVFMAGVRWLMFDWQKRNIHLVDVMHCVRFGLIAPWQLVDIRRNPESPEFIEITKDADVQRMVEDGLAFAIIKYWYGHESHDYYHWIDLLGLSEPASRNWAGTEKNYLAYREFLADLENYRNSHSKAVSDKKKSKSHVDDTDSLDEDTVTREHMPPSMPVMSVVKPPIQGNRKNQTNVMQPPPPPPPIPTMVEFIARRGDQNGVSGKSNKR